MNANVLITGQPGAGKTTLARWLARRAYRLLVLDPVEDYRLEDLGAAGPGPAGAIAGDPATAVRWLVDTRDEPFALIYRPANDSDPSSEYETVLRGAELVQRTRGTAPLVVVVDEASLAGDTYELLPQLHRFYNLGRRWRVSVLTIIQDATDVHRVTRRNAGAILAMRQLEVAGALSRKFDPRELSQLEVLRPGVVPLPGRHFLSYPPGLEVVTWWSRATNPQRNPW